MGGVIRSSFTSKFVLIVCVAVLLKTIHPSPGLSAGFIIIIHARQLRTFPNSLLRSAWSRGRSKLGCHMATGKIFSISSHLPLLTSLSLNMLSFCTLPGVISAEVDVSVRAK
jgi:hypothetical protein